MTTANLSPLILGLVPGEEFQRSLLWPGCGAGFRLSVPAFVWWVGFRALVLGSVSAAGSLPGSLLAAEAVLFLGPVPGPEPVLAPGPELAAELLLGPVLAAAELLLGPALASEAGFRGSVPALV
jgi:hypothetical protein